MDTQNCGSEAIIQSTFSKLSIPEPVLDLPKCLDLLSFPIQIRHFHLLNQEDPDQNLAFTFADAVPEMPKSWDMLSFRIQIWM